MASPLQERDPVTRAGATAKKPLRFEVGVGLVVLYPLMWAFAAVVPFLPLETGAKAGLVAADLIAAEVLLLLGIACVGKETYRALKARFRRRKRSGSSSDKEVR